MSPIAHVGLLHSKFTKMLFSCTVLHVIALHGHRVCNIAPIMQQDH